MATTTLKARDYICRRDNPKITAVVIYTIGDQRMLVQGPFRKMTERQADWRRVCDQSQEAQA